MKNGTKPTQLKGLPVWLGAGVIAIALAVGGYFGLYHKKPPHPTARPQKVTIAAANLPHASLVHLAYLNGYFTHEGLEVTLQGCTHGQSALAVLLEGKADLAAADETPFMFAVMKGEKISIIATISNSVKDTMIVARKDRSIFAPSDLKGKKIGVTVGTSGEFFMDVFLTTKGISRRDVQVVALRPDEMVEALVKGRVDAVATWHPIVVLSQRALGEHATTFYDEDIYEEPFNLIGSRDFISRNPETIRQVLRAVVRAEKFAREQPEASRRIVAEAIKVDLTLLSDSWSIYNLEVTLRQTLLFLLEDQSRWAIRRNLVSSRNIPNYLDFLYIDGLQAVKPEGITVIR